jgi:hypothetical protein
MVKTNALITRLQRQANAWGEHAPTESFGGYTLTSFREELAKLQTARDEGVRIQDLLRAAIKVRSTAEIGAMKSSKQVASAMKGHPLHGEDSVLFRMSGFVTEAERRSGLTQKRKSKSGDQSLPAAA